MNQSHTPRKRCCQFKRPRETAVHSSSMRPVGTESLERKRPVQHNNTTVEHRPNKRYQQHRTPCRPLPRTMMQRAALRARRVVQEEAPLGLDEETETTTVSPIKPDGLVNCLSKVGKSFQPKLRCQHTISLWIAPASPSRPRRIPRGLAWPSEHLEWAPNQVKKSLLGSR